MNIDFTLSPNPAYIGDWRASAYEASNPTAEVAYQILPGPHSVAQAVSLANVDKVTHIVKVVQVSTGFVLADFIYQPRDVDYEMITPLYFRIGDGQPNTPNAGTSSYRNTFLKDYPSYSVERRNIGGTLVPGVEITLVNNTGTNQYGFDFIDPLDSFGVDEVFVIKFNPKPIKSAVNESVAGKWFADSVLITGNDSYAISHLKKLIKFRGSGTTLTYNLPDPANAPIGYVFGFQAYGSGWTNHVLLSSTANCDLGGSIGNQFTLAPNNALYIMFDGANWIIITRSTAAMAKSDNPVLNDTNTVATTVATKALADANRFIAAGKFNIGDVPAGDPQYVVTFSNPNSYDYIVLWSIKTNSANPNKTRDNAITGAWWKDETTPATKFKIILEEAHPETQNVELCWVVVRI